MFGRRQLLTGAGMTGLAVAAAACTTRAPDEPSPSAGPVATVAQTPAQAHLNAGPFQLFTAEDLNFQTLIALGAAGISSAVGEVLTAVDQAKAAPGGATYQSVYDAMVASGNELAGQAATALSAGHRVSARARYMRAAQYYNQALFWVLGTSTPGAEAEVYRSMNQAFTASNALAAPAPQAVSIDYEDRTLPGWFYSGGRGRRPALVMNNGSDGQNVDMLAQGADAALERGYHVLVFEGPGQGSLLFEDNVVFRPDWEKVITPIIDHLIGRDDVDDERIVLHGISLGGYLVARAASREHRLAALVCDPGLDSAWRSYPRQLRELADAGPPEVVNRLWAEQVVAGANPQQVFTLKKRLEIYTPQAHVEASQGRIPSDWYALARRIQQFSLTEDDMAAIRCPTLVTGYVDDAFFGDAAHTLFDGLTVTDKKLMTFGETNGARYHNGPVASQFIGEEILDWVDETLGR